MAFASASTSEKSCFTWRARSVKSSFSRLARRPTLPFEAIFARPSRRRCVPSRAFRRLPYAKEIPFANYAGRLAATVRASPIFSCSSRGFGSVCRPPTANPCTRMPFSVAMISAASACGLTVERNDALLAPRLQDVGEQVAIDPEELGGAVEDVVEVLLLAHDQRQQEAHRVDVLADELEVDVDQLADLLELAEPREQLARRRSSTASSELGERGPEEILLAREVPEDQRLRDLRLLGDLRERGVGVALRREQPGRRREDLLTRVHAAGADSARYETARRSSACARCRRARASSRRRGGRQAADGRRHRRNASRLARIGARTSIDDARALGDLAGEDLAAERGLDLLLEHPLQRPGAVGRVVAGARRGAPWPRRSAPARSCRSASRCAQAAELDVDDLLQLLARQAVEDDDLVDAVQELGPEVLAQRLQHRRASCARRPRRSAPPR